MAGENRMVEWCDAGCSHSQQYFFVQDRRFRKIDRLQPFITTDFLRSHCTHISLSFFVGCGVLTDLKSRSPLQKLYLALSIDDHYIDIDILCWAPVIQKGQNTFIMDTNAPDPGHYWLVWAKAFLAASKYLYGGIEATGLSDTDFRILEALLNKEPLPVNTLGPKVN